MGRINSMKVVSQPELLLAACLLLPASGNAVSPLVTDDADTVERGRLQLNTGWQFSRSASVSLHSIPVNPVVGIHSRGELGLTFGYQWRDGRGAMPGQKDDSDITDLTLATKWRLWQTEDENFKLSGRLDVKLPTASESRGFGTGQTDIGGILVATRCWGRTCFDWNVGYTASGASRSMFGNDHWFLGQAVRGELAKRWTLIGETYALLPQGKEGIASTFHFSGGAQFNLCENVLFSALFGSAAGRSSPDLTGYLGLTYAF
jgi:hypothetical protein